MLRWLLISVVVAVLAWLGLVVVLLLAGRGGQARAVARLVPDCVVLLSRLARDPALSRADRIAILAVLGYLALPFDLVPDFIPIAGQLDDAIIVALLVRRLRRRVSREMVRKHWPGPAESLELLLRWGS